VIYRPGIIGADYVVPAARGFKGAYLRCCGLPDVRLHLSAAYALRLGDALPHSTVLDLGSGNGALTIAMTAAWHPVRVMALERDERAVDYARRLQRQLGARQVEFRVGDIERADLGDGYDLVTCLAVLQFVRDIPAFLHRVARCLRPGGHLLLQTGEQWKPRGLMRFARFRRDVPAFGEVHEGFEVEGLGRMLAAAGFDHPRVLHALKPASRLAKDLFYISRAQSPLAFRLLTPALNLTTAFDPWWPGTGPMLFLVAASTSA